MALYTGLFDLGVLLGGPSLGYVIDHAGYPPMFATAGGLLVAGALCFALWDRALTEAKRRARRSPASDPSDGAAAR